MNAYTNDNRNAFIWSESRRKGEQGAKKPHARGGQVIGGR